MLVVKKIAISYPPLTSKKGSPFLAQNRQFQWTNTGNVIFPVVPAFAATALYNKGYEILWDDAIAEKLSYQRWLYRFKKFKPDIVIFETKTPVVKYHWKIINKLKTKYPKLIVVLMGDHVTAMPLESFKNSQVDFVITGGDYDFMLLNLIEHLNSGQPLDPGFYFRHNRKVINSGRFALKHHNLDELPIINRHLTKWQIYAYNNTNFKHHPGAYIMSARDCWWGKCTFCSWTTLYPSGSFRRFSVKHTINQIEDLVNNFGIKEIFDDAGTLPTGPWLKQLCEELINRGLNKKVTIGCNMRFGALNQDEYFLLKKAGFRFILYGLESSNQITLDRIEKRTQSQDAKISLVLAKKAGLEPHLTIMIGYPWETYSDALNTLSQAKSFFRLGLADSMQATRIVPYPGTQLFKYCQKNKLLLTTDWNKFDMRQSVIKSPISNNIQTKLINSFFLSILTPKFILRKIFSVRSLNDFYHLFNYALKYFHKLRDFPIQ